MAQATPPTITDHPFTPWQVAPNRCNTCGKVASRHATVEGPDSPDSLANPVSVAARLAAGGSVPFRMTARAYNELYITEHDTDDSGDDDAHHQLAGQLGAATQRGNDYEVPVTAATLVYLAENLHYHIDRLGDDGFEGLPMKNALLALDKRVKAACASYNLPHRVWRDNVGLVWPEEAGT